jgi:predicted nucleic acid-binding protein
MTRLRVWQHGGLTFVAVTERIAYIARELAQPHPKIPIGDAVIAATAQDAAAHVVTDNPHYTELGVRTRWFA